jgi:hypothetical protein
MFVPDFRSFPQDSPAARRGAPGRTRPRRRRRFAPNLLALEARALLSTLTVTNDNDSGAGSLRAQLAAAHNGDTIKFAPSACGTITLTSGPLQVATSVDIKGPGAKKVTVSGDNESTVFDVQDGVTATISGLTITDGLYDLSTGYGGGGIINDGSLTLSGDTITGNTAESHAGPYGISIGGDGGGVLSYGPLTVTGSTISGNSAAAYGQGGGIYSSLAPVTVDDSTISGNTAGDGGGICSVGSDVTLTNSTVSGNTDLGIAIREGYSNGASVIPNLTLIGCTISGNTGTQVGGGILSAGSNVSVSNSLIADNTVESQPYGGLALGGGIDMASALFFPTPGANNLTITGSTFVGNQAISHGGTAGGGAIHTDPYVTLSVSDSSFTDNSGTSPGSVTGGAMDLDSLTQGTITDCQFTGDQAVVTAPTGSSGGGASGGAIDDENGWNLPGTLTIKGTTFTRDLAQGGAGGGGAYGGAINALNFSSPQSFTLALTSCLLQDNSAIGGAVTVPTPFGTGFGNGGALNLYSTAATVSDCAFLGNSATGGASAVAGAQAGLGSGGAIVNASGPLTMTGDSLVGNRAAGGAGSHGATGGNAWGGGLVEFGGTLTFSDGTILGNQAIGGAGGGNADGGGAFISGSGANASFTDVLIALNAATGGTGGGSGYGGGLYIGTGALTNLKDTLVIGNTASTAGNNIYGPYTTG